MADPIGANCSIRLFDEALGDPQLTDYGFGFYDILANTWEDISVDYDTRGRAKLQYVKGVGLICKSTFVPKDTRLSQFTLSPATNSWDEYKPSSGAWRVFRLRMYDATAGTQYSAVSTYTMPENPNIAFTVVQEDTPAGWDTSGMDPFFRIELSGSVEGAHALEFRKDGKYLMRKESGQWVERGNIPSSDETSDFDELAIMIRWERGKILMSTNFGKDWYVFEDKNQALVAPAGKITFRGQGGQVAVGVHQQVMSTGTYKSVVRNTFKSRLLAALIASGKYLAPNGSSVTFSDISDSFNGQARYSGQLVPKAVGSVPWAVYYSPVVYAVQMRYPFVHVTTANTYTTPFDGTLQKVVVRKPASLEESSATIQFAKPLDQLSIDPDNWRWRKVAVDFAYQYDDGSGGIDEDWTECFVGYVSDVHEEWGEDYGDVTVTLTVQNASIRFKRTEWTPLDLYNFDGMYPGDIGDFILASEGLDAGYRVWDVSSYYQPVGNGNPEDPCEMTQPKEDKWATLCRVFGYANLQVVPADDGTFITRNKQYVDPTVSWEFFADEDPAVDDWRQLVRPGATYSFSAMESTCMVLTYGTLANGAQAMVYSGDSGAFEAGSGRYCPWREVVQEEIRGSCDLATLVSRNAALGSEHLPIKSNLHLRIPVHVGLSRRNRIKVHGLTALRIPDGTEFALMEMEHTFEVMHDVKQLETTAGLRRLN